MNLLHYKLTRFFQSHAPDGFNHGHLTNLQFILIARAAGLEIVENAKSPGLTHNRLGSLLVLHDRVADAIRGEPGITENAAALLRDSLSIFDTLDACFEMQVFILQRKVELQRMMASLDLTANDEIFPLGTTLGSPLAQSDFYQSGVSTPQSISGIIETDPAHRRLEFYGDVLGTMRAFTDGLREIISPAPSVLEPVKSQKINSRHLRPVR